MTLRGNLLAWIEPYGSGEFMGAFVGEHAVLDPPSPGPRRAPATKLCPSPEEARQWVENQAMALGLPIKWVSQFPRI